MYTSLEREDVADAGEAKASWSCDVDAAMAQASARARGRDIRRGVEGGGRATACAARVAHHSLSVCLLYTSPSPRDLSTSRMPSSA